MSKSKPRQARLDDGQTYTGFDLNGKHHKPLTGGGLKFLQRIGSPLYTSDFKDYPELDIVLEYLYATSATPQELSHGALNWDVVSFEFASDYTMAELTSPQVFEAIKRDLQNQSAAAVEVRSDATDQKK